MGVHKNDQQLRHRVQAALDADPDMSAYHVQADAVDGEIHLTGIVDTAVEREKANKIVAQVRGVKRIENGITISTDGSINDRSVEFEVTEELLAQPGVNLKNIGVKSVGGKVFLVGSTDNPAEEQAAIEAAMGARGVTEVISQVKPKKKEWGLEEIFHSQVRNDQEGNKDLDYPQL